MTAIDIADKIMFCFKNGGTVWIFGNGGSLADASHFAAEFQSIDHLCPIVALNDPALITAIANDRGFDTVFETQLSNRAKEGDLAIGVSSSGRSENVIAALEVAPEIGVKTIDWPRVGKGTQNVQNNQYQLMHEVYLLVKNSLS